MKKIVLCGVISLLLVVLTICKALLKHDEQNVTWKNLRVIWTLGRLNL